MVNVNQTTKEAYLSDSILKAITITFPNRNITFTNSDLVAESIELTEAIETERTLTFTGCIASQLKFKVADIVTDLRGEYVTAKIQAGPTEEIYLFRGYVDTQDNETHEDIITEFTCYDALYKIGSKNMQSWVDSRTYPITVRNFRNQLFSNLGITQESKTLINDSLQISANLKSFMDAPSAVDLMRWICQLNAVYGQIGRDGQFKYRELKELSEGLYPSETTYPGTTTYPSAENAGITINSSDYINLSYEPYTTDEITKVAIMDVNGIDQGQAGTNGNTFVVQDNPIAFNVNMRSAAGAILAKLGSIMHIPVVSMECVGMPYAECGDSYVSYTKRFVCRTYILQRTLKGIQALFDEFSSDSDKDYPPYKSTSTTRINAERQTVMEIQADIVEFKDLEAKDIKAVNARFDKLYAGNVETEYIDCSNRIKAHTLNVVKITGKVESGEVSKKGKDWSLDFQNGKFNIGEIDAERITTGSLDANRISANSIGVAKLAGSLSATAKDCTNAWKLDFSKGTFSIGDINADSIKAGTIDADRVTIRNLTADNIKAHTITAEELNLNVKGSDLSGSEWSVNIDRNGSSFNVGTLATNNVRGTIGSNQPGKWGVNFTSDGGSIHLGTVTADMISADTINSVYNNVSKEFTAYNVGIYNQFSASGAEGMIGQLTVTNHLGKSGRLTCNLITVAGHSLSFKSVKDTNGNTVQVLGYT